MALQQMYQSDDAYDDRPACPKTSGIAEHIRNAGVRARCMRSLGSGTRPHGVACAVLVSSLTPDMTVPDILCLGLLEPEAHGLSQKAVEIARPFGFPITNSMVVTWIVAVALIVFAQAATRKMTAVPSGMQNFLEWLVESLYEFLETIIGAHLVRRTFWFFASIFIFILAANWISLLPGVGTIGWGHQTAHGFTIDQPLFRGANADLNMTLGMSLVFFACWIVWALQEVGARGIAHELFAPKGDVTGMLRVLMLVVFFAAGCLEIVSILFRPVSLSFRLYGNIFAGENMLEAMATMVPGLGWLLPIPFYFMELLVGLVQAMVFMLLTAVFTLLICQHEDTGAAVAHG
jgi:F-type H+-transporting ATPase subunit a